MTQYALSSIYGSINYTSSLITQQYEMNSWGLRSSSKMIGFSTYPEYHNYIYTYVDEIYNNGCSNFDEYQKFCYNTGAIGVRPAIVIDLTKANWSYAGTVSAERLPVDNPCSINGHTYGTEYDATETGHSLDTICGHYVTINEESHSFVDVIVNKPTTEETGSEYKKCTICGYETDSIEIPKLTGSTNPPNHSTTNNSMNNENNNIGSDSSSEINTSNEPIQKPKLKTIKMSSVKVKRGSKAITGKLSVTKATVKIKVGSKAYRKAKVTKKTFKLATSKLKRKTKIKIKVYKKGYKTLTKSYVVK